MRELRTLKINSNMILFINNRVRHDLLLKITCIIYIYILELSLKLLNELYSRKLYYNYLFIYTTYIYNRINTFYE